MVANSSRGLVLSVAVWTLLMVVVQSHVCLKDPVQRLQTGDEYLVDCYQNGTGPCGKDFPSTSLANPTVVTAGSVHRVKMFRPVVHYNPGLYQPIKISLSKNGITDFVLLAEYQDEPGEELSYDVQIPNEPGNYILQANYKPKYYDFYSCADLVVKAAEKSPPSQTDDSNVVITTPTTQRPAPDTTTTAATTTTTTKRFEQPTTIDDEYPPPTAPPLVEDITMTNAPTSTTEKSLSNNNQDKAPPSYQDGDNASESGQAEPPPYQGETSRSEGQNDDNSVASVKLSQWLLFLVSLGLYFRFW